MWTSLCAPQHRFSPASFPTRNMKAAATGAEHAAPEHPTDPQPGLWAPRAEASTVITAAPAWTGVSLLDACVPELPGPFLCLHRRVCFCMCAPGLCCVWSPAGLGDRDTQPLVGKGAPGGGNSVSKGGRAGRLSGAGDSRRLQGTVLRYRERQGHRVRQPEGDREPCEGAWAASAELSFWRK